MRTRQLAAEMRQASATMTRSDIAELDRLGIAPREIEIFEMIGITRIVRVPDTELYEPDSSGIWAFISPALVQHAISPESSWPEAYVRYGNLIDLIAWHPDTPRQWALRAGYADWLGCIPAQHLDPEPVRVWRSLLAWFHANCIGVVPLRRDPAITYSLLMSFSGGVAAEDDLHDAELRRILARPWPSPRVFVGTPLFGGEAALAAE